MTDRPIPVPPSPDHGRASKAAEPAGSVATAIRTFRFDGLIHDGTRPLAVERPVQVRFGGVPFGVMMMTPRDLRDFAVGFSLTEGVVSCAAEVRDVTIDDTAEGLVLDIVLTGARLHAHLARKRAMSGRTSCGLCGIEDLSALQRNHDRSEQTSPIPIRLSAIERALRALEGRQSLNTETRAVHGAAWCDHTGMLGRVREDVGRHNALDKLVGALLQDDVRPNEGFVLITSRASFEMVEKVAAFGCGTLVSISAPTALALQRAQALDLTLLGIARRDGVTAFHGAERVLIDRT